MLDVLIDIIAKCICNMREYTKAFNVMLELNERTAELMKVLGENAMRTEEESLCSHINEGFKQVIKLSEGLIDSKKVQFLMEANAIYQPSSH